MKSLIRSGAALVAAAALGAGMVLGGAAVSTGKEGNGNGLGGQPATASQIYLDEIKDYGVCRGIDPACYHEWGNGWKEGEAEERSSSGAAPRVRATRTSARRSRAGLNPPLNANNVAQAALIAWAAERGIARRLHRGPRAVPPEQLPGGRVPELQPRHARRHGADDADAVHPRRRRLRRHPQRVRRRVHWPYYEGLLGGANFYNHGPNRDGTVETINNRDVSTSFMPETWAFKDEWYNLTPYPSFVNVLLEVDKATSEATPAGHGESPPGELVPVLRRRTLVADDARSRRRGRHGQRCLGDGRRVLQAARHGGPRERHGHQAVLHGLTLVEGLSSPESRGPESGETGFRPFVMPARCPRTVPLSGTAAPISRRKRLPPSGSRRILQTCDPLKDESRCRCWTGSSPFSRSSASPTVRRRSRSSPSPPASRSPRSPVSSATSCGSATSRGPKGGVAIGLRLFELGARASTPRRLSVAALPVLAELFNATGEHLNVAVQEGRDMLSVISVRGRLRPAPSRAGVRVPSVTTALGKAVLAFTEDESVLRGIMTGLDPRARHMLERELAARAHLRGRDRPMRDVPRRDRRREPHPVARALPGRRHLGGGPGGRHGPEPDGAARAACRAGAHAPTGAAGGLTRCEPTPSRTRSASSTG